MTTWSFEKTMIQKNKLCTSKDQQQINKHSNKQINKQTRNWKDVFKQNNTKLYKNKTNVSRNFNISPAHFFESPHELVLRFSGALVTVGGRLRRKRFGQSRVLIQEVGFLWCFIQLQNRCCVVWLHGFWHVLTYLNIRTSAASFLWICIKHIVCRHLEGVEGVQGVCSSSHKMFVWKYGYSMLLFCLPKYHLLVGCFRQ